MSKTLIVGHGGRESAILTRLVDAGPVYAVVAHENPTIMDGVQASGGALLMANPTDATAIAAFAAQHHIDLAIVSADEPLAAGVVDGLLAAGIPAVGPTRAGARIEWDKEYALRLMQALCPEVTPVFRVIRDVHDIAPALAAFRNQGIEIAVKPQGLTGGKGVQVMGPHLRDWDDVHRYTEALLVSRPHESVLWVEKLSGIEFTIMFLTDGTHVVPAPATYDYSYRYDGDTGPGTGSMGAFSDASPHLPFMTRAHSEQALAIARRVIAAIRERGDHYSGVLNAGFFLTSRGLRFLEFNARFGDPEGINIMTVLESDAPSLFSCMANGSLDVSSVCFAPRASVVTYLVAPEYATQAPPRAHDFALDEQALAAHDIQTYFASAIRTAPHCYRTVGSSRCVALATAAGTLSAAYTRIEAGIAAHVRGPLQWRKDVGDPHYVARLNDACAF